LPHIIQTECLMLKSVNQPPKKMKIVSMHKISIGFFV